MEYKRSVNMKTAISTSMAPKAIGPYSQAILSNGTLYISGQLPIDILSGAFPGEDITSQTNQAIKNLASILESAGGSLSDVVKTTVFLVDMKDFEMMNAVYNSFFKAPFPARSTIEVSKLPKNARVEIEAIAVI